MLLKSNRARGQSNVCDTEVCEGVTLCLCCLVWYLDSCHICQCTWSTTSHVEVCNDSSVCTACLSTAQLQTLVSDDVCFQVMDCYSNFVEMLSATQVRAETRVAVETAYQKKVDALLNEENCFKIVFVSLHNRQC